MLDVGNGSFLGVVSHPGRGKVEVTSMDKYGCQPLEFFPLSPKDVMPCPHICESKFAKTNNDFKCA